MAGPVPPLVVPHGDPKEDRLDSWKEVAAYFGREVRTVQGWEKSEGLPIHRHRHARQGSVHAFKSELDAWRQGRNEPPSGANASAVEDSASEQTPPIRRWLWIGGALATMLVVAFSWQFLSRSNHSEGPAGREALPSVAVLPFLDLSPQKDQEYFSDGLSEEIIDALSRVPNLRVAARTSAFAFKGKAVDIRQIGRQLNVSAVLEGSVRKSGEDLRITAQLNRVSDGYHLWARPYARQRPEVSPVQRDLSKAIADQLRAGETTFRVSLSLQAPSA